MALTAGTSIGPLLPPTVMILDIPTRPEDIAKRHHNRIVKDAAREMMERKHAKHTPEHFKQTNRRKYDHKPRSEKYKRTKLRQGRGITDLVYRGRTRSWMTRAYKLRMGGNAEAGTLNARLIYTFPFRGGTGRFRRRTHQSVNIQQMIKELQSFAPEEIPQLAEWFREAYMKGVEKFRAGRKRKRIPII